MVFSVKHDNEKNGLPGFIVMNIPQDQTRLISLPSKTNRVDPTVKAVRIERIC